MENQTNQQPVNQVAQPVTQPGATQQVAPPSPIPEGPKTKGKITDLLRDVYAKGASFAFAKGLSSAYRNIKNKKIFKIIVVLFGIILFIIISGTIYSLVKNLGKKQVNLVSPSPVPTQEIILTEESKKSQSILEGLKTKILNLDIYQKHLTPPNIDFDISF